MDLNGFFQLQNILNEHVGLNWDYFIKTFSTCEGQKDQDALMLSGQWIDDLLKAISNEIEELRSCTYWKHWCSEAQEGRRYEVKDVTAARNEVIDMLHFWISLAQILGMSPEMVCGMYSSKLAKNIKRQVDGYSIEVKDLAWQLFCEHPGDSPYGTFAAKSLEDLPDEVASYYLDWAKRGTSGEGDCKFPSLQGNGCKLCGQKDCTVRRYQSTSQENTSGMPNCHKCGRKCKAGYAVTGEGPICGKCV